jgi:hypothetical protein
MGNVRHSSANKLQSHKFIISPSLLLPEDFIAPEKVAEVQQHHQGVAGGCEPNFDHQTSHVFLSYGYLVYI